MRVLLILLAIYLIYRVFFYVILPMAARHLIHKTAKTMNNTFDNEFRQTNRKEGDIRIETQESKSSVEGEYVDYTEIKE